MNFKIGCEIFIFDASRILLGKRKNCYGEGTWALPGGHLELGESLMDCAKRELKEELNIDAQELTLITVTEDISERGNYIHMSFTLNGYEGTITNNEPDKCYEWRYFDIDDLPTPIFEPHQKILKTYFENKIYIQNT